jgi:hypothetical protein
MDHFSLFGAFSFKEVLEHVLEALIAILTNLFSNGGRNCSKLFR